MAVPSQTIIGAAVLIMACGTAVRVTVLVIHELSGQTALAKDLSLKVTDPLAISAAVGS